MSPPVEVTIVGARLTSPRLPTYEHIIQMTRLWDSDLWHRTYRVQADLRTTYTFSPNDPLTEVKYMDDFGSRIVPDPLH
ncbi:MAG: enterochelin esterase domain-containing protein [Ktedonobacteraceae bacterium]|nr:DUF3327 domain-containing protein [Chloroflexota bacterium]